MANHKSSLKRIRQTETRRLRNRYYAKTMRNAVRKLRATIGRGVALVLSLLMVLKRQARYIVCAPPRGDEFIYTPR